MYGLLLEAIVEYIKREYGGEIWEVVRNRTNLHQASFATHNIYSENTIKEIAEATSIITDTPLHELMDAFGVSFVQFVGQYGYDRILKVLGRHMRDFLNGLDNLHEYLRFSYPKLKPPSFFCESENKNGLTLHYRSKRKGFLHYVKGQIRQVGKMFYNTKVDIYVITEEVVDDMVHVVFRLLFDNKAFKEGTVSCSDSIVNNIPLNSESLFELFPFHIVFSRYLEIRNVGSGLAAVMPRLVGAKLFTVFSMSRPLVDFTWDGVSYFIVHIL
ncbi:hypothetical protein SNE40_002767 [Patella caerulea]|uniref:guanylate cyclase n=1 Tax=Patella caerulea TaxID=87958 RepID=A0AAN8K6T4_PATCE